MIVFNLFIMIKRVRIKNFKCLSDFELEFRPLTILCGANSVGKSSIGQALLLLKQSYLQYRSLAMLHPTGDYVNLGGYPDFVAKHNITDSFEIEIEISNLDSYQQMRLEPVFWGKLDSFLDFQKVRSLIVNLSYIYASTEERIELAAIKIRGDNNFFIQSRVNKDKTYRFVYGYLGSSKKVQWTNPHLGSLTNFLNPATLRKEYTRKNISSFMSERISQIHYVINNLLSILERELEKLSYLGPFREPPDRFYTTGGAKPEGIGTSGQLTIDYMTYSSVAEDNGLVDFTKSWLMKFGYLSDFSIEKVKGLIRTTNLINKNTGVSSTLLDVGFGISQVLPVIAAVYLHKNGIHVFEQPEIHLHPASQADLADLFVSSIPSDQYFLIETHSEHFVNRLRTRVAQGKISTDQIQIIYLRDNKGNLEQKKISISENGSYIGLPDDFFGEALGETRAIMEARRQRKLL